jgi:hypothetical protein
LLAHLELLDGLVDGQLLAGLEVGQRRHGSTEDDGRLLQRFGRGVRDRPQAARTRAAGRPG